MLMLCSETIKENIAESIDFELKAKYTLKKKSLFNYIDLLEKSKTAKNILIYSENFKQLKNDFLSIFTIVEAIGGLVINPDGEILFIYRRKKWDLPKGKIDPGETKKSAALREVSEETGVKKLKIKQKICITNHTYVSKSNRRSIKKSHWYLMEAPKQKLIPQKSEDIEIAVWKTLKSFKKSKPEVYASINEVLNIASDMGCFKNKKLSQ